MENVSETPAVALVYDEKRLFVENELSEMLAAMSGGEVAGCGYSRMGDAEAVRVAYANGYERRVNVTGDSLKAIVVDVLDRLS